MHALPTGPITEIPRPLRALPLAVALVALGACAPVSSGPGGPGSGAGGKADDDTRAGSGARGVNLPGFDPAEDLDLEGAEPTRGDLSVDDPIQLSANPEVARWGQEEQSIRTRPVCVQVDAKTPFVVRASAPDAASSTVCTGDSCGAARVFRIRVYTGEAAASEDLPCGVQTGENWVELLPADARTTEGEGFGAFRGWQGLTVDPEPGLLNGHYHTDSERARRHAEEDALPALSEASLAASEGDRALQYQILAYPLADELREDGSYETNVIVREEPQLEE